MGPFRQHIREARRALHDYMSVPALCFNWPLPDGEEPKRVSVRIHDKITIVGDLKGTNFHYAERYDYVPRAIFMRDEIIPQRKMILTVEPGIAYRIDSVEPPDEITITANLTRIRPEETVGMPFPEND